MATIKIGILGIISGKVGGMVFSTYRGKQYVRRMPKKSNRPPTEAQKAQQLRFGMIVSFFSRLKTLVRKGYGTNKYISYHLKNAIAGVYLDLAIDYSKVMLTRGTLDEGCGAEVSSNGKDLLVFCWKNLETPNSRPVMKLYWSPTALLGSSMLGKGPL